MFEIIPAIDLLDGKVVRLTQGNYNKVTFYDTSAVDLAKRYEDNGAKRIHIVDLNGAKDGDSYHFSTIKDIRDSVSCTLELGGGIRNIDTVTDLLDAGITYIILGSILIKDFQQSKTIIERFPNTLIAGIDAKDDHVAIEGWIEKSSQTTKDLIKKLNTLPLSSIIYTDIKKDGMLEGPNLKHLKTLAPLSKHPLIASGGVTTLSDINNIQEIQNISGCIVGKAILDGKIQLSKLFQTQKH